MPAVHVIRITSDSPVYPLGNEMIRFLAHIRNIMVVLVLGWLGFSEAPNDKQRPGDTPEAPSSAMLLLR